MKKTTKALFLSQVKETASKAIQKGELVHYDLDDPNTKSYASNLLSQVQESAGSIKLEDLFKWTTEDFCGTITDLTFPEVKEGSALLPEETDVDNMVTKIADDAISMHQMIQGAADPELLRAKLDIVAESIPEVIPAVVDPVVDPVVEPVTETSTDEITEPVVPEPVVPEPVVPVEEAVVSPFTVINDRVDESDWFSLDFGPSKTKLREALESGVTGIDEIIKEVYSVVGDVKDPSTWKYPHHVVTESGEVLLNKIGLDIASNYVTTRFRGDAVTKQTAAQTLTSHYTALNQEVPSHISRVAEANANLHMISLEILGTDDKVMTIDNTQGSPAIGICVAESVANSLRDTGLVDLKDPTVITIDNDQLEAMTLHLTGFVNTLMGKTTLVAEAAPPIDNTEWENKIADLNKNLDLYKKKVDALHSLLDGSPLAGVAESVVGAEQVESVEALQSIADSIGVKRLITTRKRAGGLMDEANTVSESAAGLESLVALSKLVTKVHEENEPVVTNPVNNSNSKSSKRLISFI